MGIDHHWAAHLARAADRPPARVRLPLAWRSTPIGSVEPELLAGLELQDTLTHHASGWEVVGELTPALARVAKALRTAGLVHAWRDEQLAVRDGSDAVIGTVERGVARLLGIATHAVHLLGVDPQGHHWLQQRSLDKPNDPGLWDTLVGGMVPAQEDVATALARETWEEAGLDLAQLRHLEPGGTVTTRRPSADEPAGYVVERLTWYRCVVPPGVVPVNRDGEVAQFRLMAPAELEQRLARDECTIDAALMLLQHGL